MSAIWRDTGLSLIRLSVGDEDALNRLTIQPKALSKVDERGWIPLHEAAVQGSRTVLEIIFSGTELSGPRRIPFSWGHR